MGDDGSVGRGNRANGLITPCRPMSMEASSGKNPINHVGKIYNIFDKVELEKIINISEPCCNAMMSTDDDVFCSWCASWRGNSRRENCDHICKDVTVRSIVEYTITVPSTWKEDEVEVYAELEGRRMGLFDYLELKKVLEVSKTYFDEEFRTHLL